MQKLIEKLRFQDILALAMLSMIMCYFFWISRPGYANQNATEIKQILGTIAGLIVGFYFGSSKSSANKDQVISDAIKSQSTNVLIVLFAASFLLGCSSTHKTLSLHTRQVDSTAVTSSVGVNTHKEDSAGKTVVNNVQQKDSAYTISDGISVSFYNDTAGYNQPIIIKQKDGNTEIDPGGRKVKNIRDNSVRSGSVKDSSAGNISQQWQLHVNDSSHQNNQTKTHLQADEKIKDKQVVKKGVNTGKMISLCVVVALCAVVMVYMRKWGLV